MCRFFCFLQHSTAPQHCCDDFNALLAVIIQLPYWVSPATSRIIRQDKIVICMYRTLVDSDERLWGENWNKWLQLAGSILNVHLNEHKDPFVWTCSEKFSVKNY
jgi:hypothetical protein